MENSPNTSNNTVGKMYERDGLLKMEEKQFKEAYKLFKLAYEETNSPNLLLLAAKCATQAEQPIAVLKITKILNKKVGITPSMLSDSLYLRAKAFMKLDLDKSPKALELAKGCLQRSIAWKYSEEAFQAHKEVCQIMTTLDALAYFNKNGWGDEEDSD